MQQWTSTEDVVGVDIAGVDSEGAMLRGVKPLQRCGSCTELTLG